MRAASEPVMDPADKVARVLYDMRLEEHGVYTAAQKLIDAFPQLALEGREEWSIRGAYNLSLGRGDRGLATHERTVWESPWSEVQS